MKTTMVCDLEIAAVSLRNAWDISRACSPICGSPISPSSSARGTSAATESTTSTSIAAVRTSVSAISKSQTIVVFINQIRMKIGVMFGNPETTTGGNALKFYASVRLDIRRIGQVKDGDTIIGSRTRVKVVKNKMAPPFREVEFDILYGEGISHEGDLVDLGAECGVVEKSGAWFGFEGDRIGQGRENAKQYLRDHPEVANKIEVKVLAHHAIKRDVGNPAIAATPSHGATVHAFTPQPKPISEKKSR